MPSSTKYSTMLPVLRSYLHNPLRVLIHILPSEPSSILEISAHDIPSIGLIILLCRRNRPLPIVPIHMSPRLSGVTQLDRKSTRLNSSHQIISYAVFCL